MRSLVLSALILASAFQIAMGQTDGAWTYTVANNQATITGYTGPGGAVSIPSTVNGISVVQLSSNNNPIFGWFNTSVTSVIIPNSVTSIGASAFYYSSGLSTVTIPNSVTSIGDDAFSGCTSLLTVTIGSGVTSIGVNAFSGCTALRPIIIPNSVTSIGSSAFSSCTALLTITIPASVTSIGSGAFQDCISLSSINVDLGNPSYSSDEAGVLFNKAKTVLIFYPFGGPRSYTIPNSVTDIGTAFEGSLITAVTISSSLTSIGGYAFSGCASLTSITIPNSVTSIGGYAFNQCTPQLVSSIISNLASNSASNYTTGQQGVIANPNAHNLYTTSQIQNMAVGDLVLTKNGGGTFTLNYDIEQSTDLQSWLPYQSFSQQMTNLPPDKAFIRIKAKQ